MDLGFLEGLLTEDFIKGTIVLGSAGTIVALAIRYLKSIPVFLWERILRRIRYTVTIEQNTDLFLYLERWLITFHTDQYRNVIAFFENDYIVGKDSEPPIEDVKATSGKTDDKVDDNIKYRQKSDHIFIRYQKVVIKIYKGRDKLEHTSNLAALFYDHFYISALFGKNKIKVLLEEVREFNQQFKLSEDSLKVYVSSSYGDWYKIKDVLPKPLSGIIIDKTEKENLRNDISNFLSNKAWYQERGIPHKRGFMFEGSPGNGKSSLAMAIGREFNKDIFTLILNSIESDNSLIRLFSNLSNNSILLVEDVDSAFKKRIAKKGVKISFQAFSNCLDGVLYTDDIIVIMTTNNIGDIDSALLRAGRIDMKLKLNNPTQQIAMEYINHFFDKNSNGLSLNYETNRYSMADIQNLCIENDYEGVLKKLT